MASARRRPRSISRASRRRRAGRCSSTSTRRRTQPPGSERWRTASRATTCSTASRSRSRPADPLANLELVPAPALTSPARRSSCRGTPTASGSRAAPRGRGRSLRLRLPRLSAVLRAVDRERTRRGGQRDRPRAGGVLRAGRPLAAARLDRAGQGAPEPGKLGLAGILLTMVDGRTRLAAEVEAEVRRHCDLVFTTTVPRSVRLAEAPSHGLPAIAYDRRFPRGGGVLEGGDGACRAKLSGRAGWVVQQDDRSAAPRRGLGRGLEVLIGGGEPGGAELAQPPVDAIHANPRQPRRRFEPEATTGLASSIKQQGLLQPIVVRPRAAGGYELIAGERRWRAAREAGLSRAGTVREADDRDTPAGAGRERRLGAARPSRRPAPTPRSWTSSSSRWARSRNGSAARNRRFQPPPPVRAARGGALDGGAR